MKPIERIVLDEIIQWIQIRCRQGGNQAHFNFWSYTSASCSIDGYTFCNISPSIATYKSACRLIGEEPLECEIVCSEEEITKIGMQVRPYAQKCAQAIIDGAKIGKRHSLDLHN